MARIKDAYSPKELSQFLGVHVSSVIRRAKRERWEDRPRAGKGGGSAWLLSSMPKATREQIVATLLEQQEPDLPALVKSAETLPVPTRTGLPLTQITQSQRRTMEARLVFVREVEKLAAIAGKEAAVRNLVDAAREGRLAAHLQDLVQEANDRTGQSGRMLCRRTLYLWCSLYANGGQAALVPGHKQRDMSIPAWADVFLALYKTPQHPSVADCLRRMPGPGEPPAAHLVYRFLQKIGLPSRMAGRATGNALLKLRPHKIRTTGHLLPGDVYTADGTTFDAEIQNPQNGQPFKPEITLVLDVATRRCVGVSVGLGESAFTVLDALRGACLFGGIPAMLYCDNGSGYKNKLLLQAGQGMLARLGIEMVNSIPCRPRGKGLMERAVQTICTPLAKRQPSCMHMHMDRDAAHKVHKLIRKDLKESGRSALLPTWPEFVKSLLGRIDEYNATPHSALPMIETGESKRRHMSPNEHWRNFELQGWEPEQVPDEVRDDLFMPAQRRTVRNGMVTLFKQSYYAPDLEEFHQDVVEVRYDIRDASRVHIWTTKGEKICTAELNGNAIPYFPESQLEAAREKRKKGQVLRLTSKLERVAPGAKVELPPAETFETLTVADSVQPEAVAEAAEAMERVRAEQQAVQIEARPIFQYPYEKYEWLMRHPAEQTAADMAWLQKYAQDEEYADLHEHYKALGIAWTGTAQAGTGDN